MRLESRGKLSESNRYHKSEDNFELKYRENVNKRLFPGRVRLAGYLQIILLFSIPHKTNLNHHL